MGRALQLLEDLKKNVLANEAEEVTDLAGFMKQGMAAKKGFAEKDADPEQLKMGIEVEKEHTSSAEIARKIALDHLAEFPTYYTALKAMEAELKKKEPKGK